MSIGAMPMCEECKHIRDEKGYIVCDAFPDGIPDAIYQDGFDHTKPYPGDHGIRFEPMTPDPDAA